MRKTFGYISVFTAFLSACATTELPNTLGENSSSYSYIPLDPLPISENPGKDCSIENRNFKNLLDSLPDQAVRIAVGQYNKSGTLNYGPVSLGVEGQRYQVVLDYISVDASSVPIKVEKYTRPTQPSILRQAYLPWTVKDEDFYITSYRVVSNSSLTTVSSEEYLKEYSDNEKKDPRLSVIVYPAELISFPVYIGVGLRLTANITVIDGSVNLSSLGGISAAAEAGKVSGSLVVQTLGITGKSISTSLPLPSEINPTTIQNAILSLGSIKAVLYEKDSTVISPRVVGFYNPIGGGPEFVNGIISTLASAPPDWDRPCETKR